MKKYALFFQLFYYKVTEYHILPATIFQLKVLITFFFFGTYSLWSDGSTL